MQRILSEESGGAAWDCAVAQRRDSFDDCPITALIAEVRKYDGHWKFADFYCMGWRQLEDQDLLGLLKLLHLQRSKK